MPQLLELQLSDQTTIKGGDERNLTAALSKWLMNTSLDEPYRDILISFQAMFSLFTPPDSSQSGVHWPEGGQSPPYPPAMQEGATNPFASDLINLAFEVSTQEAIGWRAFYTTYKVSPKMALFNHLNLSRLNAVDKGGTAETGSDKTMSEASDTAHTSSTSPREIDLRDSWSNSAKTHQFGRFNRQFLYNMLVNRVHPFDGQGIGMTKPPLRPSRPDNDLTDSVPIEPSLNG